MKSENSTAQIKCTNDSAMHFYQSQCIHITNLEFIGCGGNQVRHVGNFVVEDTKFEGQENSSTALELIETTAQIVNSTFSSNRKGLYTECVIFNPLYGCVPGTGTFVGGAIIATNSTVDISRSRFEDNRADYGGAIFAEHDSIINMSGNVFVSSNGDIGGVLSSHSSTITIEGSEFHDNSALFEGGVLYIPTAVLS
jgi:predicted outer membrane repeat protein